MFSHAETLVLFSLTTIQGAFIALLARDSLGITIWLGLPCGLVLGFVTASLGMALVIRRKK
jgi:hypothetical protein